MLFLGVMSAEKIQFQFLDEFLVDDLVSETKIFSTKSQKWTNVENPGINLHVPSLELASGHVSSQRSNLFKFMTFWGLLKLNSSLLKIPPTHLVSFNRRGHNQQKILKSKGGSSASASGARPACLKFSKVSFYESSEDLINSTLSLQDCRTRITFIVINMQCLQSVFSSPELKAQVSFSDLLSSLVCLSVRLSVRL